MRHLCILLLAVLACCLARAQAPPATPAGLGILFGDVADSAQGAPIPSAYVLAHSEGGPNHVLALDQLGRFDASLPAGSYDVFISADGFKPFSTRVSVIAGKPTRLEARLDASKQIMQPSAAPSSSPQQPATQPAKPAPSVREYNEEEPAVEPAAPAPPAPATQTPAAQPAPTAAAPAPPTPRELEARDIAIRFAPVWHQRMAGGDAEHRFDLCTVFDFDGDWIGNNNWTHAADPKYKIWAFVYYSVIETEDHYYLHYACYHPRDWSAAPGTSGGVLGAIQQEYEQIVNKGAPSEAGTDQENDLAGVLLIVDKWGDSGPAVAAAEIFAHDHLLRAVVAGSGLQVPASDKQEALQLEDGHPAFYIESQKHGIRPFGGEQSDKTGSIVVLRFGKTTELSQMQNGQATYDLVSIRKTFYQHALEAREPNDTYGTVVDLGDRFCAVPGAAKPDCSIGAIGAALRGDLGRSDAALAPWVWFDRDDTDMPTGSWFFDPAGILVRHFGQQGAEKYLYNPYLGIDLGGPEAATAQ